MRRAGLIGTWRGWAKALAAVSFVGAFAHLESACKTATKSDEAVEAGNTADAVAPSPPIPVGSTNADHSSPVGWVEAVRLERWEDAQQGLEALAAEEKTKPEIRYVRGRVALARKEFATARDLLEGLESTLPLLADSIVMARAKAQFEVGPFEKSGNVYSARNTPDGFYRASLAFEKAGDLDRARWACDLLLKHEKKTHIDEEHGHAIRLRIDTNKETNTRDARWLSIYAIDDEMAQKALSSLQKLDPAHPLLSEDWLTRAKILTNASHTEEALHAIETAVGSRGKATPLDICHAKADALFRSRSRYSEAATTYRACASLGGPRALEDSFLSARALLRADKDTEAAASFAQILAKNPRTQWGDLSSFNLARIHLLHGRYKEAAAGFDSYISNFAKGAERKEADRFRALSHLFAKNYKAARTLAEHLTEDASDPLTQSRWATIAAYSAMQEGDRTHAVARWSEVVRSRPLSWPALVARTRLSEAKAPIPAPIEKNQQKGEPEPLTIGLPPPVDMLHRIGLDGDADLFLRDRENAITQSGRGVEALCSAYAMFGRGKRMLQLAQQIPFGLLSESPSKKTQWAWECAYPHPYVEIVHKEEEAHGLPHGLIFAVMRQESAFDPSVVSPARAVGLLQLLPETAKAVAEEAHLPHSEEMLTSPPHNIALGAIYLKNLITKFKGNIPLAVAAYNAGPEAVQRWVARGKGIDLDLFAEEIPYPETRNYVAKVMGNFARYAYLEGGEGKIPEITLDLE